MLKIKTYALLLISVLGLAAFTSCDNKGDNPTDKNAPEVEMEQTELNVGYEGGTYTIKFTVNNPVEGQYAIATPEKDWISEVFVDDLNGIITFDVAANAAKESRQSYVEVNYPGVQQPAQFIVIQEGYNVPLFSVSNVNSTLTTIKFDLLPLQKSDTYIVNVNTEKYIIEYGLEDDEALFQDDIAYFEWLGYWYGMSAEQIMAERAHTGDSFGLEVTSCIPGSVYVVYAYYVDLATGERTSEITRFPLESASVELDEVAFEWEYDVDEGYVYVEISPENYSGYYYFDMLYVPEVEDYIRTYGGTIEEYIELWWNTNVSNDINGGSVTANDIISGYCSQDFDTYTFDLWQESDYYLVAFAVESHAFCGSTPKYELITTGTVSPSDLVVTPYVSNIKSIRATIGYTASNSTDPYLSGIITAEEFNSFGSTQEQQLVGLINAMSGNLQTSTGSFSGEVSGLTPATEYVSFAFGYRGGVPTTDLFSINFTTLSDEPGAATVQIINTIGYFNLHEIAELNSNYAGTAASYGDTYGYFPAEVKAEPFGAKVYYESYVWTSEAHYQQFIEENPSYLMENILYYGIKPTGRQIFWVEYGKYNTIISFAEDSEGRYSAINVLGFTASMSGTSNAQLFIDWLAGGASIAPNYVELRDVENIEPASSVKVLSNGTDSQVERMVASTGARYSTKEEVAAENAPAIDALSAIRK